VAVKEVKENKMPLATAAKTFGVTRNTVRSRLTTGSVSKRQLGKAATLNTAIQDQLVHHLHLLYFKGFGLTDVRELAFQSAEKNKLSHTLNLQKQMVGMIGFIHFYTETQY
jgi:hypothetical protein